MGECQLSFSDSALWVVIYPSWCVLLSLPILMGFCFEPRSHYLAQDGLPAPVSPELGLKVRATTLPSHLVLRQGLYSPNSPGTHYLKPWLALNTKQVPSCNPRAVSLEFGGLQNKFPSLSSHLTPTPHLIPTPSTPGLVHRSSGLCSSLFSTIPPGTRALFLKHKPEKTPVA